MAIVYTDMFDFFGYDRVNNLAHDPVYDDTEITSGSLNKGYRYTFLDAGTTADFENVGLTETPAVGVSFYATGTTPTEWGGATLYIGQSPEDIINTCLTSSRSHFTSIALYVGEDFSEDESRVANALMYYTMYLLYVRNQKHEEGEDEKEIAYEILIQEWGDPVRRFLQGQILTEQDRIIREIGISVEHPDNADFDDIDWTEA